MIVWLRWPESEAVQILMSEFASSKANQVNAAYWEPEPAIHDFDNQQWSKAQPVQIARRWSGEIAPPFQHAEARIIWSNESLLVRFVCRQVVPPIVSNLPQLRQKTIGLWDRDVCEIFVAPNPETPHRYLEFEAAPNGEWVDLAINLAPDGRETNWDFQSGMTTAARMSGDELTIVIRIPWSETLPRPSGGDEWRVNLFRCVGVGNERYLAWLPTHTEEPNFHVPEVFGWLKFDEEGR